MAADLQQLIERLTAKTSILVERYNLVVAQRDAAVAQNSELRAALRRAQTQVEELSQRVEYLKISRTVAPDRQDLAASRAVLSELVREIDKCINELRN